MAIWTIPFTIVVIIICLISVVSARKTNKASALVTGKDSEIPEVIEDHPFTLNPIFWIILIATVFTGIVIVYYATSF